MWNIACVWKVLVLAIFSMEAVGTISKPNSREQVYLDVLKNITRVNNIINELLQNYKHLKEIYETKAKPRNELSSEIDISDEYGRDKKTYLDNDPGFHPVTQMIPFEDAYQDESTGKSREKVDVTENRNPQFSDNTEIDVSNEKEFSDTIIKPHKNFIDLTRTDSLLHNKSPDADPSINLSTKPELVIIGTALRYSKDKLNSDNGKQKKYGSGISVPSKQKDFVLNKTILRSDLNNVPKVSNKKYGYKDLSKPTMWESSHEFSQPIGGLKKNILHQHKNKNVIFIIKKRQKDLLLQDDKYNSDSEKSEQEMLRKEEIQSKILRDAYGNACLKVAIRKCYKTLIQVRKLICTMDFKCRNSFKDHFKSYSKTGCIHEFDYKKNDEKKQNYSRYTGRKKLKKNVNIRVPDDTTRTRPEINYYELCLPAVMSEDMSTTIIDQNPRDLSKIQPINALRDRYEKECKRLSTEKCKRACYYAVTYTCRAATCERHDKKTFKRTCQRQCKHAFGGGDADDSGDDSETDDDDDDDNNDDDDDDTDDESFTFE